MHIRPFEIVLIGIFVIAGIIGVIYLANYKGGDEEAKALYGESVVIWGTLSGDVMNNFLIERSTESPALKVVSYTQIDPRRFEDEFVNAVAEGRSPDLIIIPHALLVAYRTKLSPITFEKLDARTFKDTYVDGAEIFMRTDGIYGLPFAVDPIVMYWNRDIFSSSGLALPPKTWETLVSETTKAIVRTDEDLNITQSAVSFGEYGNVSHAKDILAMLFLQAGSGLVEERDSGYVVTLNQGGTNGLTPGDAVLPFYTQFTNPTNELYSWNRSKSLDRTEFLNGKLALYFGKGSEKGALERENANLNFDVAQVPQGSGATIRRDYGDFYAFAIPRGSRNGQGAYAVASLFTSPTNAQKLVDGFNLAPVHRASFAGAVQDPFKQIMYQSALISRGWLDPSPNETDTIFKKMVDEVATGRTRTKNVIMDAVYELESLLR